MSNGCARRGAARSTVIWPARHWINAAAGAARPGLFATPATSATLALYKLRCTKQCPCSPVIWRQTPGHICRAWDEPLITRLVPSMPCDIAPVLHISVVVWFTTAR